LHVSRLMDRSGVKTRAASSTKGAAAKRSDAAGVEHVA
jgi:hypothetical protein